MNILPVSVSSRSLRTSNSQKLKTSKMAFRAVIFAAVLAVANAGYLGAPVAAPLAYAAPHAIASPALVSQQSNILRTPGNLGQVSTYSKTINTPYSSVSKSDVRVSNDALAVPHAPLAYASAPVAYASPIARVAAPLAYASPVARVAAPVAYAAPVAKAVAPAGLLGVAYSAAPAVAHMTYSNSYGIQYAY